MSKNVVTNTANVEPDPDEPDLPDDEHRGAINLASEESFAEQSQKREAPTLF